MLNRAIGATPWIGQLIMALPLREGGARPDRREGLDREGADAIGLEFHAMELWPPHGGGQQFDFVKLQASCTGPPPSDELALVRSPRQGGIEWEYT